MNKACISISATIPTSENTFEFVEPGKRSFDIPAPLISMQSATPPLSTADNGKTYLPIAALTATSRSYRECALNYNATPLI